MAKITIEADTPEQLVAFVRNWLEGQSMRAEGENIARALRHMYGPVTRAFVREVAEAAKRGEELILDSAFAKRQGKDHAGQLGGAIGAAWVAFDKAAGREVLQAAKYPRRYWMSKEDAQHVLDALKGQKD